MPKDTANTEPTSAPTLPSKAPKNGTTAMPVDQGSLTDVQKDEVAIKPANLDTPESDAAIDDIVAHEADEVLAAQDAGIEAARTEAENMPEEPEKHGHPIFWFIVVLLVAISVVAFVVLTNPGLELPFAA